MRKRTSFIKLIQFWGVIFLIAVGVSIVSLEIISFYQDFNTRADKMREDYIANQKEIIKREVNQVVGMINDKKAQSETLIKSKIKIRVYEAYSIIQNIYQRNKSTKSKDEIQQMVLNALRPIRFEHGNGYYFAIRLDGVEMLFADKPEMEGSNLLELKDTHGQYVIKDMIEIARQSGEGFYQYNCTKPDAKGEDFKKTSYIKKFEPFDWIIGAGFYNEEVEKQLKDDILSDISRIRFDKEGYIFINRLNGDALVTNGKLLNGTKKLWEVFNKNSEKMKDIFKKEYNAAQKPNGDYIYYTFIKLTDPNVESPKASFIYGIAEWQWIVGAGVYLDDVEADIAVLQKILNKRIKAKILYFVLIDVGIVVLFLLLFSWLTHRLRNNFNLFVSFFDKAAHSDEEINRNLVQFVELDLMAKNANKMLRDRIHAQQDILDEKEKLFVTLKSIGDGVITTDLSSRIELINVVAEKLTGWRFDEAQGKQLSDIFTIVNAKTKEETKNPVERVLENGKIVGLANDTMLISRNGTEYQIYDSAAPIKDVNGRITGVVFVFQDVTKKYKMLEDLRQSEAKSSAMLAAIPDLIFVQNRDGVFLNCYTTSPDKLFVPVERFLGKRIQDIFSKEIASPLIAVFEQALATSRIQIYEYQLPMAGKQLFFEARIVLYGDDKVLSIIRDITERREAEEELQKMEKLKSIGTLAGGIAHDFNNILTGIYGNISMAKEAIPEDTPGVEFLKEAENSMARATRLTKQLLTFAKGGEPVKEDVNIGVLVEEVVRFDLSGSNVKPVFDRARDLWMAEVDKSQIQQVFSNLTINADQAMPDGGHLFVTLENVDISKGAVLGLDQGKYVRITVRDEGIGIDQKHFEMIFDPYYSTKQAGSGLGLATVYSVITKHGGHISVDSEIGKGTIFVLYLPALESRQQPVKSIHPEVESPAGKQTGRVLVMDDEEMIHKLVTRMLGRSRFSVETAYDGRQAIEMYKQALGAGNPFDVVIMDITVPGGMGGKEAVREILEINPEARVIASSGYANDPVMASYAEYGFKGIVAKPYTRSKMLAVLNQVLGE